MINDHKRIIGIICLQILFITSALIYTRDLISRKYNITSFLHNNTNNNKVKEIETSEQGILHVNAAAIDDKVVVVDAGHGGYDAGCIGQEGTLEKEITLAVAIKLGMLLEKQNVSVIYTRRDDNVTWPSDNKMDLAARAKISNDSSADLFISIHLNSFKLESIKGIETYYYKGSVKGKELSELIQSKLVEEAELEDRGIRAEDYSIFRNVRAPTVLVELGYISNRAEEFTLKDPVFQDSFAGAMASAIMSYLSKL